MVDAPAKVQEGMFSEAARGTGQLARERLLWALQPMATVIVVYGWVLNPAVVDSSALLGTTLWGFVFGLGIGVLGYRHQLKKHFVMQFEGGVYSYNRVPEEFYWGAKAQTLFMKEKK